jgi:hypothetical protein
MDELSETDKKLKCHHQISAALIYQNVTARE